MKFLILLFLFIFVLLLSSCEPDELDDLQQTNKVEINPIKVIGDTGGGEDDVIDDTKTN